jgi:hypothetical protein
MKFTKSLLAAALCVGASSAFNLPTPTKKALQNVVPRGGAFSSKAKSPMVQPLTINNSIMPTVRWYFN